MTDAYALIGEEVSDALSPAMMAAAFEATGIDATYQAISVAREEFRDRFLALREKMSGFNLTIPYKSAVIPLLDGLDETSGRIGAVNVVRRVGTEYLGYNTDVDGIVAPLKDRGVARVGAALLLGAGGAARAFCEAMSRMGCREVTVAVRRIEAGERFAGEMAMTFPGIRFRAAAFDDLDGSAADLVFNATPLGSRDQPLPEALKRVIYGQMVVFDAVYRPMRTELLEVAEERGCRTIPGYEMLLNQGTAGFEIWTGRPAPREAMGEALRRSLGAES